MKAKIYIPIIIGAGAAAGLILGFAGAGKRIGNNTDQNQTMIAQETTTSETTLSEEEKKKAEELMKQKEAEENQHKEDRDKKKKEEEEKKKKEEEEKKKKEEEEKKKQEEKESEKSSEQNSDGKKEDETETARADDDTEYEYIYVPVNNNNSSNTSSSDNTPATTQHTHNWEAVYKTQHHDAVTHNERRVVGSKSYIDCTLNSEPFFTVLTEKNEYSFYQVCTLSNGDVVFETNKEDEKKELSFFTSLLNIPEGDSSYSYSERSEDITKDVTVTDRDAYDERVFDHYVCTGCGQTSY